jgi:hypothetical protein
MVTPQEMNPLPVFDAHDDLSGRPWVDAIPYSHRFGFLPPLWVAYIHDGTGLTDTGSELLPPPITPACACPDVAGLTRRAAELRAIRRHNRRAKASACPGRFLLGAAAQGSVS